jgi:hypothetical protein
LLAAPGEPAAWQHGGAVTMGENTDKALDAGAKSGDIVLTGPAALAAAELERLCEDERPEFLAGVDDALDALGEVLDAPGRGPSAEAMNAFLATLTSRGLLYIEGVVSVFAITNRMVHEVRESRTVGFVVP